MLFSASVFLFPRSLAQESVFIEQSIEGEKDDVPPRSPLRKEWQDLCVIREDALRKALEPQNAADAHRLEILKNQVAAKNIELAKHCLKQIEAVKRGELIEADRPESQNSNSHLMQLWRIKEARDKAIRTTILRYVNSVRKSYLSLQQRAIKANDFDLVGEIKNTLDGLTVTNAREPWLGTYKNGNITIVISRENERFKFTVNGNEKPVEWNEKGKELIIEKGRLSEWRLKLSPDGARFIEVKGSVGKTWKRIYVGLGSPESTFSTTSTEEWLSTFKGKWRIGESRIEIKINGDRIYFIGSGGYWMGRFEGKVFSIKDKTILVQTKSEGDRLFKMEDTDTLIEIDKEERTRFWRWWRDNSATRNRR